MADEVKTIDDLPHFHVMKVAQSHGKGGNFEVIVALDRIDGVTEGRACSLLLPRGDKLSALPAYLEVIDQSEKSARIQVLSETRPEIADLVLTYVRPGWNPHHVWMVALPTWKWSRVLFQATDAISEVVKGSSTQIVDGEEVNEWIKIKQKGKDTGLSRYRPIFPSGRSTLPSIQPDGLIKDGWDHTPCELCMAHISAGNFGYTDPGEHWVCEKCYEKYVVTHDLSFMFPETTNKRS